jgi:hypothetical protein
MDDILAVLDELAIKRCTLLGIAESAPTCILFAASYPERVERLIVYLPAARGIASEDYPWARTREEWADSFRAEREGWGDREYLEEIARFVNPQWAEDPEYVDWFVWLQRYSASPGSMKEFRRLQMDSDVTDVLPAVRVPSLVLTKRKERGPSQFVAERIPGARIVELPGVGLAIQEDDGIYATDAIEAFLRGDSRVGCAGQRACNASVHGPGSLYRARDGGRRQGLARPSRAASCARATGARTLPGRGAGHGGRRLLRNFRRSGARDSGCAGDPGRRPRARPRSSCGGCTPGSASSTTTRPRGSPSQPEHVSRLPLRRAKCSSPRL